MGERIERVSCCNGRGDVFVAKVGGCEICMCTDDVKCSINLIHFSCSLTPQDGDQVGR